MMMRLILVTGGARGGKSRYAAERARRLGGDAVTFVATAMAGDDDMRQRIARHQRERPATWATIEAPSDAGEAVRAARTDIVLLDCLTMLTANALGSLGSLSGDASIDAMLSVVEEVLSAARTRSGTLIIVTNEVGFGVHPPTAIGRWFQDGLGRANQRVAAEADEVVMMVAGIPMTVKPSG